MVRFWTYPATGLCLRDKLGQSTAINRMNQRESVTSLSVPCGADTIITQGATQSNHARQTVAIASRFGMECHVLVEHGTGTQAGLATGLGAAENAICLLGIGVRVPTPNQEENVFKLAQRVCRHIGKPNLVQCEHVVANCDDVGDGYGLPTAGTIEAVTMVARLEAILLDSVYSGKAMAGLIDLIRRRHFKTDDNVVFVHTGGSAALFGYRNAFSFPDYRTAHAQTAAR